MTTASRGVQGRRPLRRSVAAGAALGAAATAVWLVLRPTIAGDDAESERTRAAAERWLRIGRQLEALATPGQVPAAGGRSSIIVEGGEPRVEPLPPLFGPAPAAEASILSDPDWLAEVSVAEIEVLAVYESSLGAVARVRCARRDGALTIRAGDRLNDGEVTWVGFFSPRLAAVRLEQWPWPPPCSWHSAERHPAEVCDVKPYREVLRVLGWDAVAGGEPLEVSPSAPRGPLRVAGPEALGWWPEGRYVPRRRTLVRQIEGEPRPRVDLFAAVFCEIYGVPPWQHGSWSPRGWTVEEGFPLLGSIRELEGPEQALRDPFRPPWQLTPAAVGRTGRPGGLAGLLVDEIELEATYVTLRGPVAEIGVAGFFRPLILRPGDQLWDGEVVRVNPPGRWSSPGWRRGHGEVVLKQSVNDPTALGPFREVVKTVRLQHRFRRTRR